MYHVLIVTCPYFLSNSSSSTSIFLIHPKMFLMSLFRFSGSVTCLNPAKLKYLIITLPSIFNVYLAISTQLFFKEMTSSKFTPTRSTGYKNFTST